MAAVATFLKGTVSESLKALVQPVGLVPATIFVLLNLAFIYPTARDRGGVAKTFSDLNEEWQVVVVALLIVAIGYLLLNAANAVTDTLAGETWSGSLLHFGLRRWQRFRRDRLATPWSASPPMPGTAQAYVLATRFPPREYVRPTRLGNALVAAQHVLYDRYGLDLAAFWEHMQASVKAKDAPALALVKDEKATLDLLSNLVLVLVVFAAEGVVFFTAIDHWDAALASLLALAAAYLAYRIGVLTAYSWGEAVAVVFDLHREDLKSELGLSPESDPASARGLWLRANDLYTAGAPAVDEPAPSVTVKTAPVIDVKTISTAITNSDTKEGDQYLLRFIDYVFIVSRSAKQGWSRTDFIVDDPRVARIDASKLPGVDDGFVKAAVEPITYQDRKSLRWRVQGLGAGGSVTIAYRLPLWTLKLKGTALKSLRTRAKDIELEFPAEGSVSLDIETFAPQTGDWPTLVIGTTEHDFEQKENHYTGTIELSAENRFWRLTLPKS